MFHNVNLIKTLYFNLKVFSFLEAIRLPVRIYGKTIIKGLYKGCVLINKIEGEDFIPFKIGESVFDPTPYNIIRFGKNAKLEIGSGVRIMRGGNISINDNAELCLGNDIRINQFSFISCSNKIEFGNHVSFGWRIQVIDSSFHCLYDKEKNCIINPLGKIKIGSNVWVASNSSLMKNTIIPSYSIVSSNSVVNKDFSDIKTKGNFFAGIPAKLKRTGLFRIFDSKIDNKLKLKMRNEVLGQIPMSYFKEELKRDLFNIYEIY